jgi:hypothetical protein
MPEYLADFFKIFIEFSKKWVYDLFAPRFDLACGSQSSRACEEKSISMHERIIIL